MNHFQQEDFDPVISHIGLYVSKGLPSKYPSVQSFSVSCFTRNLSTVNSNSMNFIWTQNTSSSLFFSFTLTLKSRGPWIICPLKVSLSHYTDFQLGVIILINWPLLFNQHFLFFFCLDYSPGIILWIMTIMQWSYFFTFTFSISQRFIGMLLKLCCCQNTYMTFTVFFNCLHTKSLLVTQFLKPNTQTAEPHTKSAKPYTNSQPLTQFSNS